MSVFTQVGAEAVKAASKSAYLDHRRQELQEAWAEYYIEAYRRTYHKEADPVRYGFDLLHRRTDAYIMREAEKWARSCRELRLYRDDFESEFRFVVAKAALMFTGEKGDFFDYLRVALRNKGRSMVRTARAKKNLHYTTAIPLPAESEIERDITYSYPSAEDEALAGLLVDEVEAAADLTVQERELLHLLRQYPDAKLQDIADRLCLRDRKQAQRVKQRLARKVRQYFNKEEAE